MSGPLLESKLDQWLAAGLIDQSQLAKIRAFESSQGVSRETRTLRILGSLAGFSIGLGLISIIAANWDLIPAGVKLGLYFFVLSLLAYLLAKFEKTSSIFGEVLSWAYLLSILAGVGLIAQIYHLHNDGWRGLALWSALGLLPTLRLRRAKTSLLWTSSLLAAVLSYIIHKPDGLQLRVQVFFLGCAILGPMCFELSHIRLPATIRPWARPFILMVLFIVYPYTLVAYDQGQFQKSLVWATLGVSWTWLPWFWRHLTPMLRVVGAIGLAAFTARTLIMLGYTWKSIADLRQFFECIAALAQGTVMAILTLHFDQEKTFVQICLLMFLRVGLLFVTLFGSLLTSGTGLVGMGLVLSLLLYMWQKHHPKLRNWLRTVGQ